MAPKIEVIDGKTYLVDEEKGTRVEAVNNGKTVQPVPGAPTTTVDGKPINSFDAGFADREAARKEAEQKSNVRTQVFSWAPEDPERVITLWTPNNYASSGAIPSYMPQSGSLDQIRSLFRGMNYDEKRKLKDRLWAGGFYMKDRAKGTPVENSDMPPGDRFDWSQQDDEALQSALNTYMNSNSTDPNRSFDTFLTTEINSYESASRAYVKETFETDRLSNDLQSWATENLGRQFKDSEVNEILKLTLGFDLTTSRPDISSQVPTGSPQPGTSQNARYVNGGGPDSSALRLASQLSNTYGLQTIQGFTTDAKSFGAPEEFVEAFEDGRAVKITGDAAKMLKFHEWARTQQGEGKLFENVRAVYETNGVYRPGMDEPNAIIISINEGAEAPYLTAGDFGFDSSTTDLNRFLNAVKRSGDFSAYRDWDGEGANRRGAYGISDDKWEVYTDRLGIDSADRTPNSQDRVAAAWINDLWNKYKNWEDVGYAVRLDEAAADRRIADKRVQGAGFVDLTPEADRAWVNEVFRKMPLWTPVYSSNGSNASMDSFNSIYGGGAPIPLDSFAGMPTDYESAKYKAANITRKIKGYDIALGDVMSQLVKTLKVTSFAPGQEPWNKGQ
jgi:muramidase (phage lysozyme)